jgi:ketosteroid isomerase-like protein
MSEKERNVEVLKEAYRRWFETRGQSADHWLSICAEKIRFGSLARGNEPNASFLTDYHGRDALRGYFTGLIADWEMMEFRVDHFVADGDRVVMIGHCTWRYRKNGIVVATPKLDTWRFADGKAIEYFEFYDTAQVHAAVAGR